MLNHTSCHNTWNSKILPKKDEGLILLLLLISLSLLIHLLLPPLLSLLVFLHIWMGGMERMVGSLPSHGCKAPVKLLLQPATWCDESFEVQRGKINYQSYQRPVYFSSLHFLMKRCICEPKRERFVSSLNILFVILKKLQDELGTMYFVECVWYYNQVL